MSPDVICGDANSMIPDASLVLFGTLISSVHMAWMRVVCKAHHANDTAVLEAYGFPKDATESDIVARLFKMYQELTNKQ